MKRWTQVFKAMANINRLKIIKLLADGQSLTVADIASKIDISFKATSKHLIILYNLDVLESQGKKGHVFYSLNSEMPRDLRKVIHLFL